MMFCQRVERVMGGVHCIFSGDFLQLPPVMASFLFLPPRANDSPETMLGGEIWQQMLSRSIILTEQMRQSSGTVEFAEILDGLRTGNGAKWAKKNILI